MRSFSESWLKRSTAIFTIRVFPNVDHEMRLVTSMATGAIDPEYLETMRDWLSTHVLNRP